MAHKLEKGEWGQTHEDRDEKDRLLEVLFQDSNISIILLKCKYGIFTLSLLNQQLLGVGVEPRNLCSLPSSPHDSDSHCSLRSQDLGHQLPW